MPHSVATVSTNGILSRDNRVFFRDFLNANDIEILLIQEVTTYCLDDIAGYMTHCNIGTEQRDTAFVFRYGITVTDMERHLRGRTMAG